MDMKAYRERVRAWWSDNAARLGADSAYYLLAASAFLPLLTEPDLRATAVALVGGVGGNLLANVLERLREIVRDQGAPQPDNEQVLGAILDLTEEASDVRELLDALIDRADSVQVAREALRDDWSRFATRLLAEIETRGGSPQVEQITRNLVQVTGGGVAAGGDVTVQNSLLAGRDLIVNYYGAREDHHRALCLYLDDVMEARKRLPLFHDYPEFKEDSITLPAVYTAQDVLGGEALWDAKRSLLAIETGRYDMPEAQQEVEEIALRLIDSIMPDLLHTEAALELLFEEGDDGGVPADRGPFEEIEAGRYDTQDEIARDRELARRFPGFAAGEGRTPLVAAANAHRRLVLIGGPGTGKSAFVSFLCICMAGEMRNPDNEETSLRALNRRVRSRGSEEQDGDDGGAPMPHWRHGALLPLFVRLRDFADPEATHLPGELPADAPHSTYLLNYLENHVRAEFQGPLHEYLMHLGGAGALLVLDGLDEVATERREPLRQVVEAFSERYPACRIIVTSRPYAYTEGFLRDFRREELAPLTDEQIEVFARQWYHAAEWDQPEQAQERAESLVAALHERETLLEMARPSPLVLTMMALVHKAERGQLPRGSAILYDKVITLLLKHWNRPGKEEDLARDLGVHPDDVREMLEWLAYRVHAANAPAVTGALLIDGLDRTRLRAGKGESTVDYRRIVMYLDRRAGILMGEGGPRLMEMQFQFPHQSIQEYLAARALILQAGEPDMAITAAEPPGGDVWSFPANLRALFWQNPERWREVAGWAADERALGREVSLVWDLVNCLCEEDPPDGAVLSGDDPAWLGAMIMGEMLARHSPRALGRAARDAQERVRLWLRRALEVGALPPPDRAAAGRVLAVLGDDRPGVCQLDENGVPVIDWVTIPAGPFLMGNTKETDPNAYDDEAPQHTVDLPAYRISRYPVTNAQYEAFVRDDGYTAKWRACWTDAGWAWKGNRDGPDNDLDADDLLPNHPRVSVTWYEAHAFSQWLGARLGYVVRMPTEAEWEKAARGTDGRRYPWGDRFDASRCNMDDTGIGQTSAVGMFPLEDGPWGVESPLDMSGNVWEWCQSQDRDYLYNAEDGREDISGGDNTPRVLRGGAFNFNEWVVRCAYRDWRDPYFVLRNLGFRVCAPSGLPL